VSNRNEVRNFDLDSSDSGQGLVWRFFEYCNEKSGVIKNESFYDKLNNYRFLKKVFSSSR
jgi:hypothetical protein